MKLYDNLNEISLARFIDVYSGDHEQLIKEGCPDEAELHKVANDLVAEYLSIVGGKGLVAEIENGKEIGMLKSTITCLCICQSLISLGDWQAACNILDELGYKLSPDDHTAIESKIKSVLATKRMRLDLIRKDIPDNDKKPDPDYFIREIALVMTHFKMVINENDISAKKYAYMIKQMANEVEAVNQATRKTNQIKK